MKELADIEKFARTEIDKANTGEVLGKLIDYKRQLVAGFNHKLTFETEKGTIEIVIFDQPWTNTREVTSIDNKGNNELIEWSSTIIFDYFFNFSRLTLIKTENE